MFNTFNYVTPLNPFAYAAYGNVIRFTQYANLDINNQWSVNESVLL